MNVEPFLVTSTVEGVLAQRLVRTICTGCREVSHPTEEMLLELGVTPDMTEGVTFYQGKGCADCNYSGYRGRIGIFEILMVSEEIKNLILDRAPTSVIRRQARKEGMKTMREDGWEKIVGESPRSRKSCANPVTGSPAGKCLDASVQARPFPPGFFIGQET
jgi:type II secretory ATPase GspE/PulE/Tfp pilus assembly ATPase PilB-like protein